MHRYRYATGDVCSSIQGAKSKLQQRVARGKDTIGKWAKNQRAVAEIIANNLEHILHRDPTSKKKDPNRLEIPFRFVRLSFAHSENRQGLAGANPRSRSPSPLNVNLQQLKTKLIKIYVRQFSAHSRKIESADRAHPFFPNCWVCPARWGGILRFNSPLKKRCATRGHTHTRYKERKSEYGK